MTANFENDFEKYMFSTDLSRQILAIQTEALAEICRAESGSEGARKMREIAEKALLESVKVSRQAEVN